MADVKTKGRRNQRKKTSQIAQPGTNQVYDLAVAVSREVTPIFADAMETTGLADHLAQRLADLVPQMVSFNWEPSNEEEARISDKMNEMLAEADDLFKEAMQEAGQILAQSVMSNQRAKDDFAETAILQSVLATLKELKSRYVSGEIGEMSDAEYQDLFLSVYRNHAFAPPSIEALESHAATWLQNVAASMARHLGKSLLENSDFKRVITLIVQDLLKEPQTRPTLLDEDGHPIKSQAVEITAPGGYLVSPSDELTRQITAVLASPISFEINKLLGQVEAPISFSHRKPNGKKEEQPGRIVYTPPPDWGEEFTDAILGKLLNDASELDRFDLYLYALIMNELPRHGAKGFRLGPETIQRARGKTGKNAVWRPEELVDLHRRLHRLARLAVYAPTDNVYISGRYYSGVPFQGGGLINVGHPIAYLNTLAGKAIPAEWLIQPGPVGLFICEEFGTQGHRPQFGIYPQSIFALDLERREGAFRLALHITQLWRVRAGRGKTGQLETGWVPRNLFEMAGISLPEHRGHYQKWLDRRHDDFEALAEAGLLHSWEWSPDWAGNLAIGGTETRRERGWFDRILDDGRLILEPHPNILRQLANSGLPEARRYLKQLSSRPGMETSK